MHQLLIVQKRVLLQQCGDGVVGDQQKHTVRLADGGLQARLGVGDIMGIERRGAVSRPAGEGDFQ